MPVRIPPGLYGGGAFKIDSTAATDYYLKQKAKEDAKAATLEKYFSELPDKANSAGMRTKDLTAFDASVKNAKGFFYENKDAIVKGNPEVRRKYDELLKIPFNIAQKSKDAFNRDKQLFDIYKNPELKERLTEEALGLNEQGQAIVNPLTGKKTGIAGHDEAVALVDASGQVRDNPLYSDFDFSKLEYNPKLASGKEIEEGLMLSYKNIPRDKFRSVTEKDPSRPYGTITTNVEEYSDGALKEAGEKASIIFDTDKSKSYTWKKMNPPDKFLDPANATDFNRLNGPFKKIYQRDIQTPKDHWIATAISMADNAKVKGKPTEDVYGRQKKMLELRTAADLKKMFARLSEIKRLQLATSAGNLLDEIEDGDIPGTNYKAQGGVIYDQNGNEVTDATITIPKAKVSGKLIGLITQNVKGFKPEYVDNFQIKIENGKPSGISTEETGTFGRDIIKWMQDVYTKKTPYTIEQKKTKPAAPKTTPPRGSKFPGLIRNK